MEGGSGGGELGGKGGYPLELTGLSLSSLKFSFFFSLFHLSSPCQRKLCFIRLHIQYILFVYEYKSQSVHGQRARDQLQDPFCPQLKSFYCFLTSRLNKYVHCSSRQRQKRYSAKKKKVWNTEHVHIIPSLTWLRSSVSFRIMWPLAPLQISWRRGTHHTQWGPFTFSEGPGPEFQTTLSAQ